MYRGVNLSGAEFAPSVLPGVHGTDYLWQSRPYGYFGLTGWVNRGLDLVSIPFTWERLQPVALGPLNAAEETRLRDTVYDCLKHGVTVALDCHNYGRYFGNITTADKLSNLWMNIDLSLGGVCEQVLYGLMNEPHDIPDWNLIVQEAVFRLRETGVKSKLLVSGNHWSSANSWLSTDNASKFASFVDPERNFAFDVHQYVDSNSSGTSSNAPGGPDIGVTRIRGFQDWCYDHHFRAFLGEFGVSKDRGNMTANWNMLKEIERHPSVWDGWAAWGAGNRWGSYRFALEGDSTPDMVISQFF